MDIKKFLASWNGILFILLIGFYLMFPAVRGLFPAAESGKAPEIDQVQLFVGGLAVVWALRAVWDKLRRGKDE